jgi:hypothetical protein
MTADDLTPEQRARLADLRAYRGPLLEDERVQLNSLEAVERRGARFVVLERTAALERVLDRRLMLVEYVLSTPAGGPARGFARGFLDAHLEDRPGARDAMLYQLRRYLDRAALEAVFDDRPLFP